MSATVCNNKSRRRWLVCVLFVTLTCTVHMYVRYLRKNNTHVEKMRNMYVGNDFGNPVQKLTSNINTEKSVQQLVDFRDSVWSLQNYEFVAFKQKPGWHFKYPVTHHCKAHNVSVRVRHSENASEIVGAHLVFFSTGPFELSEWETLRKHRNPGQIWLFSTQEPASIVPDFLPPKAYRFDTYNWSFTFHSTSDVHGAYGWYTPNSDSLAKGNDEEKDWFAGRPKFAAWVSSRHCGGLGWDRTKFVKDLAKYFPVDMYGACGNLTLRRNAGIAKNIFKKYKFHFSLENSCCSEYLTEKVWNALENWESVPIVLGGTKEEYAKLMPPHSYIHADNFSSLEELANYIKQVGANEDLYNHYFHWRRLGTVKQQSYSFRYPALQQGACKVVKKLKELGGRKNVVDSFDPYGANWFGSCYRCGEHTWIQDNNFWWRRTIFRKDWEDNRTLHWLDKDS